MKEAWPWVAAVALGYVSLIVGVLFMVPLPWNILTAVFILLMALKFMFTIMKVARMGPKATRK